MAYLGQGPFQEFTNPPTKDSFTGDGSTTTFDMAATVPSSAQNALEVYVDNVRQEPGTGKAFTLGPDGSNDMKRITFSAAPANGASIYVINDKTNTSVLAPLQNDLNGTELILDGDGDTSITADSDDRIDFKIGGTDHFHITSSSSDTVIQNKVDAKDFLFNQYDGRTILEINDAGYVALANGATGSGELRIYEDTDNGTNYTGFKVGAQSADIDYVLPTADGSSGQALVTNGSGVLSFATAGAITSYTNSTNNRIVTSVDSSTVNSEANLTFDGSALQVTGTLTVGADDTGHDVIFYGATASANMTWDESVDDLILNGAARIVIPDGQLVLGSTAVSSTAAELNLLDGVSGLVQADFTKLAAVDSTAAELNIVDGGTSATSTTVADADRVVMNDNGTMVQVAVTDLAAYFDDEITAMPNLVSTGALDSGSITSGFGNIDNGASNITSGGLVKLDVDADADDVSGDSATGRLTIGAGEDLNFYHGGTNSYIVNDTGDLIIKTGASDEDFIIKGNDGGSEITALTLDMSAAGKATFNDGIVATTGTFSGALAGTLSTAAQTNVTSLGTLTGLTVDDVAIDGKVVTMTGSSSDTAVFTAGTNGTLSIVTTDAAAAAANITITADGTAELAGTTVTLNSSGGVTLDADNGTITFADAGSSLGTITSSGYSGTAAVATTVTITDNESTNENNAIVFTAGADLDGGNLGLESDGDLFYNPSTGTISATALDISGNIDIDGTTNLDAVDVDGNMQIDGHVTVGANDQGYDVIFYGDTASANIMWDTSADDWIASGAARIVVPDGNLVLGSTAITSTAAELNILDGVTATAAEINLIDGGTARGTTAVADADGLLHNDGGTMRMTSAATFKTYFQEGSGFASGTDMIFFQTSAPTGWTKSTANNDKALRVVSGNGGGSGGSQGFSSFAHNLSAGAHTLATNEIPSHSHSLNANDAGGNSRPAAWDQTGQNTNQNTANTGGGASHSHSLSGSITTPHYIDVIVAAKD